MEYNNPWTYNGSVFTDEDAIGNTGFVYLITNKKTGRMYIGKKLLFKPKTIRVKGKKKKTVVPSDWKEYYGSCRELLEDIEKLGKENFTREILFVCKTKGECSYIEAREQFARDVLMSEDYYNGIIQCRINSRHLPKTC